MTRRWLPPVVLLVGLGVLVVLILQLRGRELPAPDVVAANEVVAIVAEQWPTVDPATLPGPELQLSVVDASGTVLAHRGPTITDPLSALRARAATLPVILDGVQVGVVYVADPATARFAEQRDRVVGLAIAGVAAAAIAWLIGYLWVIRRFIGPFERLRRFAQDVAEGNLDAPLRMDRGNSFGAFTESFDLMRDEIARARTEEAAAKAAKIELIAQLGHDIRTPVASIGATAELLALDEQTPERAEKLETIRAKATQIDSLVTEVFHANDDEAQLLAVRLEPHPTTVLSRMLAAADTGGLIRSCTIPEAMIDTDLNRLQQIFDNVLENACKYARAPVEITGRVDASALLLDIQDLGPGAPDAELDLLLGKGYRAANAVGERGFGLGLYTAAQLAARMGGELTLTNRSPGLQVRLTLPVSR